MKNRLIQRIGRIIAANFNALQDAMENSSPEEVMGEAIRELERAVREIRSELGRLIADRHLIAGRLTDKHNRHGALSGKIEQALGRNREDLAKIAIAEQIRIESQIRVLETKRQDYDHQIKTLETYIQNLQSQKGHMQAELQQAQHARHPERSREPPGDQVTYDPISGLDQRIKKATAAFEQGFGKATGLPSMAGGHDRQSALKLAQLEELAHQDQIQKRLAELKKKAQSK